MTLFFKKKSKLNSSQFSPGNQRLAALNAQAFAKLSNLKAVSLGKNYCIHRTFYGDDIWTTGAEVIRSSCGYEELDSVDISCERFRDISGFEFCVMNKETVINASNFVVADLRDEEIEGITFNENKNIEYLPYKIHMQLPNLDTYWARKCAIKQITKENFEKLIRLKSLDLTYNQIQKISGNTFKGLESLTNVDLGEI